jgi:hypothetical protein
MDLTGSSEMPSCSEIDLAGILPAVFQHYLVNLINNLQVVIVSGRPGRGASQVEKSPCLNWATQVFTAAHDGACSHHVSFRMA